MSVAADVRKMKERNPELYCADARCLWRVVTSRGVTPCPKHPVRELAIVAEQQGAEARVLSEAGDLTHRLSWQNEALDLLVRFDIRDHASELTADERHMMAILYDRGDVPEDFCAWVAQRDGNVLAQARAVQFAEDRVSLRKALDRGLTLREWLAEAERPRSSACCYDCKEPLDADETDWCCDCVAERAAR